MENPYPEEAFELLSSKNLSILEEQLSQEALMISKLRQYSRQCTDSELKNLCSSLAEKHKSHTEKRSRENGFSLYDYIMSIPPIPPGGMSFFFSGMSATRLSVVSTIAATDAAFCSADLTTLVGSRIPAFIMSTYSPL